MALKTDDRMAFVPEAEVREGVALLYSRVERQLNELLPDAEIQHVGSTAIPGCLTKGDLDVQVRVTSEAYVEARRKLADIYAINAGGFIADDATSFENYDTFPPHGVHLTVIDGSGDIQWRFRDALRASEDLREDYNDLKRSFEERSAQEYRNAKYHFVLRVRSADSYPNPPSIGEAPE